MDLGPNAKSLFSSLCHFLCTYWYFSSSFWLFLGFNFYVLSIPTCNYLEIWQRTLGLGVVRNE